MWVTALADTHVRPGTNRSLPDAVCDALIRSDAVLHAGDVLSRELLEELASYAPVYAVLGNNDRELVGVLPETRRVRLDGVDVAMVHDPGARNGRAARLHRRFPDADVVVFGHTHEPCAQTGIGGQLLFNPGSPTQRRRQPFHTFGVLELRAGRVVSHRIERV
jgi:putative phosphoesterase